MAKATTPKQTTLSPHQRRVLEMRAIKKAGRRLRRIEKSLTREVEITVPVLVRVPDDEPRFEDFEASKILDEVVAANGEIFTAEQIQEMILGFGGDEPRGLIEARHRRFVDSSSGSMIGDRQWVGLP